VNSSWRRGLTTVGWTIGGSILATFAFQGGDGATLRQFAQQLFANVLLSGPCVALCIFGLPIVVPFAHRRFSMPFDWIVIVAALVVFGMAGVLAGGIIAIALGLISPHKLLTQYAEAARMGVFFTVIFGLSGVFMHELRARLSAETRLASLESRVDPHFLFNTLNSIAALVRDRPDDAERVIEQLSALMRSSLDKRQSLVPIEDELNIVRSYLEIERVRFGDRLRFTIDMAPDAAGGRVPRMSLQTIVENSVKYAVSPSRDGASIAVTARRAGDRLHVSVEDDGPGFNPSHLPEGHGLHLLKSRLAMAFGNRGEVCIESAPGRGDVRIDSAHGRTVVSLDLPLPVEKLKLK
jgi:signal transduction histidine kinase